MRDAVESLREHVNMVTRCSGRLGGAAVLICHVLNTVRATPPEVATQVCTLVSDAFDQGRRRMDEGIEGLAAFDDIVRVRCCGRSRSTPTAVLQVL